MKPVDAQTFAKRLKFILMSHKIGEYVTEDSLELMLENIVSVAYEEGFFDLKYLDIYLRKEYNVPPEKVGEILKDIQSVQEKLEIRTFFPDHTSEQEDAFFRLIKSRSSAKAASGSPQSNDKDDITLSKAISLVSAAEKSKSGTDKIKCPRCGFVQPLSHRCLNCNLDIENFYSLQKKYQTKEPAVEQGDEKRTKRIKLFSLLTVAFMVLCGVLYMVYRRNSGIKTAARPVLSTMKAIGVSSSQINLNWECRYCNQKEYKIERKTGMDGTYSQIAAVGADKRKYSDTGLLEGTTYCYKIFFNSYAKHFNISCAATLPAAPSELTAEVISESEIRISWTNNSNNADGFVIDRKVGDAKSYSRVAVLGRETADYSDADLKEGENYCYRVSVYKSRIENSSPAEDVCAETLIIRPPAPANLKAIISQGDKIYLSWRDNSANEDGFIVERRAGVDNSFHRIKTVGANVTQCNVIAYPPGTGISFRIKAYNSSGESAYSNEARVVTPYRDFNQGERPPGGGYDWDGGGEDDDDY